MERRNVSGMLLCVLLLLLAPGSGLAGGPPPAGPADAGTAAARRAADAPWFKAEIDTWRDVGQHASVAIDRVTGVTYVSYYDRILGNLLVAEYVGSGGNCGQNNDWYCYSLDSASDVGRYSSIAARGGWVYVSYHDATQGGLKVATYDPGSRGWQIQRIAWFLPPQSSTGLFTSIQVPPYGPVKIAYYGERAGAPDLLQLASRVGSGGNCGNGAPDNGEWDCQIIQLGEGAGQYASLALDNEGLAHIAYYNAVDGDLWYATSRIGSNCGPGNTWTCIPVTGATTDAGRYASLYMDGSNHFHIAYYDATNSKLMYAREVGSGGNCGVLGSAQCDAIASMPAHTHPLGVSMAQDAAGFPVIAYESPNGSLNLARPLAALDMPADGGNCGPADPASTWRCETLDPRNPHVPYRNADYASIEINSAGLATIAYYGFITASDGNLLVAFQQFRVYLPLVVKGQ